MEMPRSSSRYRSRVHKNILQGQLLPEKTLQRTDADDAGEEEEDEDIEHSDPHFMDAEEIAGGGTVVTSWTPKKTRVVIKDNGVEHHVTGVFPLLDPWWCVTVKVKCVGRQYFTQGHPSYEIIEDAFNRKDDGKRFLLSLFLRTCGVNPELVQSFLDWLPEDTLVGFQNLPKIIANYAKIAKSMDFTSYLLNSDEGQIAMRAHDIPLVLKYLPGLFPRQVKSLLMVERKHKEGDSPGPNDPLPDKLQQIETILSSDPWKLGFGLIVSRELHLYRCEASWENLRTCKPLLVNISELQTHALIIYNKLKSMCYEFGDTYIEQKRITDAVWKVIPIESAWDALKFLKDEGVVVSERQMFFLHNLYKYEKDIATYIHQLLTKPWGLDFEPDEVLKAAQVQQPAEPQVSSHEKPDLPVLDEDQKKAVRLICSKPVTVISGRGGCGKTTIVSHVFKALIGKESEEVEMACQAFESDEWDCKNMWIGPKIEGRESVLFTAPTGKAASLLRKKTGLHAATLHQVTCSYSRWKKPCDNSDSKKEWNFSKVKVLVVDEGSLVSVDILSTVLKLLSHHGKLAKLILLGDFRQLPSIEPGNLLADVYKVLDGLKLAVELRNNHRAESQLIVDNATRISRQQSLNFDAQVDLSLGADAEMPSEDKKFILVSLSGSHDLQTAVKLLLAKGPGLQDDDHSQFIAFRKNDCMLINQLCCKHYSQHNIKNSKGKFEFQCNDKVCCTKNAYVKDLLTSTQLPGTEAGNGDDFEKRKEPNADKRLCNGEVFFITHDVQRDGIRELTLTDDDQDFTLNYKALMSRSGMRHAWARTIHTFQGSEEDTVVYVLGTAGRQNWKHVYTAVTRGCKRVYIIAKKDELDQAIKNKARERKTRLQQRLNTLRQQSNNGSNPTHSPATQINDLQTQYPLIACQDQLPSRAPFLCVPGTPTQRDNGDHPVQADDTIGGKGSSPAQKRTGGSIDDHGTPSKVSCLGDNKNDVLTSPLATASLQNLSIGSPCTKQLKF
uniref:DNA helicase B n=1 Tax=Leptobrachium leishanense TaxID=445787 RepID=A0A8C5QN27_9ANUR